MKLLATRIVASSFLGRSKSLAIISKRLEDFSLPDSSSVRGKEKRATSAPEIKAEQNKSIITNTRPKAIEKSIEINNALKLEGSGSN